MGGRVWDKFLSARDQAVMRAAGLGAAQGFGQRPALLVVDVNYAFCGERREPILESIKSWRQSSGEVAWDALPVLERVIAGARERGVPVIYTTSVRRADNWDSGSWSWKNHRSGEKPVGAENPGDQIMSKIAPAPRDIVIRKQKPSAFFGTPLLSYLTLLQCDSVIVAGTATSGCVRATVVDAFSHNFRVAVVEDGCFERSEASHAVSLFDMHSKYADVVTSEDVLAFLRTLPRGLFKLPEGAPTP